MTSNSEIIKNDIFRYEFINKFIKGKCLDHKSNNFTLYHSARILLQNRVSEIYHIMDLSDKEISIRKKQNDGSISLNHLDKKNFETSFDSIISFQNLNQKNIIQNLEFYHSVLKRSGILFLSVSNKTIKNKNEKKINQFSIDDLKNIINSKFVISEIYSQRFREKVAINYSAVITRKIKKYLAKILKKMGKIRQIYQKNIKKTVSKFDPYKQYFHKIPDEDFVPRKYKKNDEPLFLILICRKK